MHSKATVVLDFIFHLHNNPLCPASSIKGQSTHWSWHCFLPQTSTRRKTDGTGNSRFLKCLIFSDVLQVPAQNNSDFKPLFCTRFSEKDIELYSVWQLLAQKNRQRNKTIKVRKMIRVRKMGSHLPHSSPAATECVKEWGLKHWQP